MNPKARNCAERIAQNGRRGDLEKWRKGVVVWNSESLSLLSEAALQVCSKPAGALLAEAFEAALEILRLLAFARVPHKPERAGGVDLHAQLNAAKKGLPGTGMGFSGVKGERALGDGIRIRQQGPEADDLAAGERDEPIPQFQAPAPAVRLVAVGDWPGMGHGGFGAAQVRQEDMPVREMHDQPRPAFVPVAGAEVVGAVDDASGDAGLHDCSYKQ